jgi:hypothetical protein
MSGYQDYRDYPGKKTRKKGGSAKKGSKHAYASSEDGSSMHEDIKEFLCEVALPIANIHGDVNQFIEIAKSEPTLPGLDELNERIAKFTSRKVGDYSGLAEGILKRTSPFTSVLSDDVVTVIGTRDKKTLTKNGNAAPQKPDEKAVQQKSAGKQKKKDGGAEKAAKEAAEKAAKEAAENAANEAAVKK